MGVVVRWCWWPPGTTNTDFVSSLQSLAGLGSEKDEDEMSYQEKKALDKKRRSAQRAPNRERREKHRQLQEEREAVRRQLRERYNLNKPTSIDEGESEEEEEEAEDEEKLVQ